MRKKKAARRKASGYCICGGMIQVSAPNQETIEKAMRVFWSAHQGDGHAVSDSVTASKARRDAEEKAEG